MGVRVTVGAGFVIVAFATGCGQRSSAPDDVVSTQVQPPNLPGGRGDERCDQKRRDSIQKDLVGLTEERAIELLDDAGCGARVIERDGEPLPATMDFIETRANLAVDKGEVTRFEGWN